MKNLKDLQPILAAMYALNRTNGHEDEDIRNLVNYAYHRILNNTTNLLMLACIGRTKDDVMPEVLQILKEDTKYLEYLEYRKEIRK